MKYFNECLLICEIIFISIHILRSSELYDENIPVHFISEGSYLIVAEGDQVLLPCKTNVLTEVVISWYKDDIRVAENLTFSFRLRSANREDAGFYHCVVKTAYGGIRSRKTRLEIGYLDPPSEVKVRSFIVVTLDQGVIIWPSSLQQERRKRPFQLERQNEQWKSTFNSVNETYKSTSSSYYLQAIPFPQATWTINNAPVPSTLNIFVSQLEQAIVLLNIDKEMDSKVIRARLINGYGSEVFTQTHVIKVNDPLVNMATYSLDLILPPKDASLTLRDDQPGTAIFECVFNARPPHALRVQWFRRTVDGKRELINPSNMILLETKKAANYNQTIYRFDTSGLNRTLIIDNILPNVIPSDYFQQNIQKGIYSEEYTCHAYLNDYNSNNIFDMSNFLFEDSQFTSSTLNYASSTSTTNLYKSISPISTTARLKLYLPPKIHYPRNLNVNTLINRLDNKLLIIESSASMNIQLPCELDCVGIPKAEIKWLRNGDFIDTHKQERYYIHLNKTLIIKNLKLTDAGVFQCYAYNEVGEDFLNIWLKVTSFAPRLCNPEENTENITVLKESTAVLTCLIHGAPTPEYKWYKETNENEWIPIHQLIQKYTNHNYSSIMNKNIFRQDVTLSDNKMNSMQRITNTCIPFGLNEMKIYHVDYKSIGRYKCEAVNYLGNESAFIYLNVYARTIPVHHLPNSITAFVNQSLSIMCSFYIDHYTLGEINWFHGRKESALNIQKNKTYNSKSMLRNKRNRQNDKVTTTYGHIHSVPKDPMITYFSRDISHKHKMPLGVKEYGSILHIDNVDISHQGYYVCEILSPGGNYTLRTELKVVSLPTTPTDLSITNNFETNYYDNNNNKNNMGVQLSWRQQRPTHQPNITQYAIFIYKLPEQNNLTKQTCEVIMDEEWELFSIIEINETVKILTDGRYTYTVNDSSIIFHSGSYCVSLSSVNFLGWSKKSIPVLYSVSHTRRATLPEINIKLYLINVTSTSFHIAWVTTLQVNKLSLSSVKEYQLYYWIENSDFMEVKRCSNVDRFIQRTELSNLKSSTKYHLKISACNEYGCGRFSNVLHVQTHPHELHKIPSRISVTVYQTNEVKISFFSDYIYRDDHYIEQLEGYLIKLSCIDPPGCFDLQVYVPVECVTNSESFAKHKFRINHNNLSTSIHCKKLNQIKESAFIYSANVNNSNNQISIVLKSLSPYSLYELYIAYVYTHQIGPFSKPAEIFRTHEDIPSQIVNLMVNTDTRDGLIVDWDEPDKPNGKILQYILHYTEIKPIDSSINIYRPYDNLDEVYNNETFIQSNNISDDFQEYIGYWSEQSPQYHGIQQFSSTFTINTNSSNFIPAQTRENRKLAGYYSLNRTTRRVHIESLISKHIYQIRIFALNTAGLSSVTLQLGFTSVQPLSKHKYQHTEKNFVQWINLIHLNKHQEKTFKWLSNTYIQFISSPMIVKINAEDAEFSIEFELKQNDHVNHLPHPNKISPTISNFSQIMKLVEKCKWPIRIQQIPLNGYQAIQGNTQINSWSWRIIMAHKYKINSSLGLSGLKSTDFSTNKSAQVALSFKLLNLSSYNFYRIQVWQPIGLLFGNYDNVASKKLLHSNKSNWFTTGCKPPKTSPSPFYVNILYLDKMKVTWQPLSPEEWSGIPGGYVITVQLVETKQALNLLTTHTNTNETVNIQSKCGLEYLQVFINDSTASSYIIEDMKLDGEYTVGIRAASVEIGNSSKLLLGPQAIIQPISISKQAKDDDETRYLTWMRKSKFIPYNLKVSREADWVVIKWKENLKVDCGILPKGYQLIFNKLWFNGNINETLHYNESVNFVKFISLNDTSLNRNKILQSSDSFYENILKLPLKIFFNLNEMCHFDGYLRFRLHNIGQLINKNTNEEAIVYVNLEAERIRHRLLLRKIIPLTKQKKARVLITWIPNIFNEKPIFPYKNLFTLQWTRLDPISYENLSLPSTRIISWPDVNNPILLNNEFATSQSNSRILSKQRYSEYLIAVDELLMDATYLFQLVETNFSQTIETEQNDKKKCSSVTKLLVYIKNVDNSQTVPKQRPITPKIKISKSGGVEELDENTICPTTKVHLAWPNYLRQLQSNQTTEYSTGFIYTSPVTNYTLQYAEVNNNCLNEDIHQKNVNNYACVTWKTYQVKPQFDDQNDFIVDELLPNKMYIFRLAAKTISGESPFSLPTNILITDPQRPCYIPLKLEAELISDVGTEITQHSDSITSRQSDVKTNEYCEYILVKWKVLENHLWNSQPGWYHITYKLWPSDNQNTNNQLFNLFIKHDESKIINSYLQVELRNLLPYRYYIISIEAINEYTLNSIHSTITQLSSSVLINSGYGCNYKQLQLMQMKQIITSLSIYTNNILNNSIRLSKPLQIPMNFYCISDSIQVLIKCTWEYNEFKSILGYLLEVHSFGDMNHNISYNFTKIHSIFIKPHIHGIRLYSPSSITQQNSITYTQTIIKPYHYYKMSIHIITAGGHGPKVYFPQTDYKNKQINFNVQMFNSTESNCLFGEMMCTSQSPPDSPFEIISHWLSRNMIKLEWLEPKQLNGKLVNYRITWSEIAFPFTDDQLDGEFKYSTNYNKQEKPFTAILSSLETTYTVDKLSENTTYMFMVEARTQSKQNDGWGRPICIYATTSYCWFNSPKTDHIITSKYTCDLDILRKTVYPNSEKLCSFNLPILRRPLVFISSVNKTSTNPQVEDLTKNSFQKYNESSETNTKHGSTMITVLWSEATPGINSITQIIIEIRYSWSINEWHFFTMINSSMTLYTFDLKDLSLTKHPVNVNNELKYSVNKINTSTKLPTRINEISEEVTIRMIAAAFADANVPMDSTAHVAIQFRVSPVNQFQIGLPSQESDWIVIKLKGAIVPFYYHWWFITLLGLCGFSIVFILLIILKWNLHKKQQINKQKFDATKCTIDTFPSKSLLSNCCLSLKTHLPNNLTRTINNNIQPNGICDYPNMLNSNYNNKTGSPITIALSTGLHLTDYTDNVLHRNQTPLNLMLNNHNWDVLYNASPEILIANTDSTVGSNAPSNKTVSTSEVERFDEFTHSYNNGVTSQGLFNTNQPICYPEVNLSIHPSYNFSPLYSLENNQVVNDFKNSINDEMILNQNLHNQYNSNYLCTDQLSGTPYVNAPLQNIHESTTLDPNYLNRIDNNKTIRSNNLTSFNQINTSLPSIQNQCDTIGKMQLNQKIYNENFTNQNYSIYQHLKNPIKNNLRSVNNNHVSNLMNSMTNNEDNKQSLYQVNSYGENDIMSKSHTNTYESKIPNRMKYNSLQKKYFNKTTTNSDYNGLSSCKTNTEMQSYPDEYTSFINNQSTVHHNGQGNKYDLNFDLLHNHLPLNSQSFQTSICNTKVIQTSSNIYPMTNENDDNTNDMIRMNENPQFSSTKQSMNQQNIYHPTSLSIYKNNDQLFNNNNHNSILTIHKNNDQDNLSDWNENLDYHITTDLELLTSTEV